jgi:hypothetical protein
MKNSPGKLRPLTSRPPCPGATRRCDINLMQRPRPQLIAAVFTARLFKYLNNQARPGVIIIESKLTGCYFYLAPE